MTSTGTAGSQGLSGLKVISKELARYWVNVKKDHIPGITGIVGTL